ncbi:Protein PTHB1 [Halotydeus destructor]|nr:Protein PTHB1 [Halotydeus destructor]
MSCELINRLQSRGVKFDSAILNKDALPTEAYLQLIDDHLAIRKQLIGKQDKLAKLATEYRTIEKRFLVKLKDRNPTPLNDLDLLLDKIYSQIARLTEDLIAKSDELSRKTSILNCATDLILKILTIGANLKVDQISILRATLTNCSNHDEGWQERTELALSNLLTNHMKDMKDVAQQNKITLEIPKDSERLKQLLIKLIDKTYSGEILSVKNSSNSSKEATSSGPSVKNFVTPSNEIIPEEDEEEQSLSAIKG